MRMVIAMSCGKLTYDFIEFAKERYGREIRFEPSDTPDTFEKIFGTSFIKENKKMNNSEITIRDAIEYVDKFNPCKIMFNDIVLYDDYDDSENNGFSLDVISNRLWRFDNYIVKYLTIKIVDFHHSIIAMQGEYQESE